MQPAISSDKYIIPKSNYQQIMIKHQKTFPRYNGFFFVLEALIKATKLHREYFTAKYNALFCSEFQTESFNEMYKTTLENTSS